MNVDSQLLDVSSDQARSPEYRSADELPADLGGLRGPDARCIAGGYLQAVREMATESLDARAFLEHLRGDAGEAARQAAEGYVRSVADGVPAQPPSHHREPSVSSVDAKAVIAFLEREPSLDSRTPLDAVRSAVSHAAPQRPEHKDRSALYTLADWVGGRHMAARMSIAGLVCAICIPLVHEAKVEREARSAMIATELELSQRGSRIASLVLEERRFEKDSFINLADEETIDRYAQKWDASHVALAREIANTAALELDDFDRQALAEIASDFREYSLGYRDVLSRIKGGQIDSALEANHRLASYKEAVHRIEANAAGINDRALQRLRELT